MITPEDTQEHPGHGCQVRSCNSPRLQNLWYKGEDLGVQKVFTKDSNSNSGSRHLLLLFSSNALYDFSRLLHESTSPLTFISPSKMFAKQQLLSSLFLAFALSSVVVAAPPNVEEAEHRDGDLVDGAHGYRNCDDLPCL